MAKYSYTMKAIMSRIKAAGSTPKAYKAEYKRVAKVLDQRMRELARQGATQHAYKSGQRAYGKMFPGAGDGKMHFERVPKTNDIRTLRSMINTVVELLNMPSSTRKGIREITRKAARSLNANPKYKGINIEPGQLGAFFESEEYKKLLGDGLDSDTIVKGIAYMRTHREKIEKALNNFKQYHVHGNYQNKAVRDFIEDRVNNSMVDFDSFMSGFGL